MTEWLGIDAYKTDIPDEREVEGEGSIEEVEAYRGDLDAEEFWQVTLEADHKVGFKADVGVPDDWDFVGLASIKTWGEANHGELGELYAVWAAPDSSDWGATRLDQAEPPEASA